MSFTLSLAYLTDAVEDQLGDVKDLIPPDFIQRALNEGQRRYEPTLLRPMSVAVSLSDGDTTLALPSDYAEFGKVIPSANSAIPWPAQTVIHGATIYFGEDGISADFTGTLLYYAHYPAITDDADCLLPQGAADGLVSFALYKAWKRIASNRTDYRKYSTLVNNATSIADLEALSEAHFTDYQDARDAASSPRDPEPFYS